MRRSTSSQRSDDSKPILESGRDATSFVVPSALTNKLSKILKDTISLAFFPISSEISGVLLTKSEP